MTIDAGVMAATALDGIEIRNSQNVYFKIKNCTLFNGTIGAQAGIHLYNTSKGLLIDNDCSTSYYGIYLEGSTNNTIQGNYAYNNTLYGIRTDRISTTSYYSYNNSILDNICYYNGIGNNGIGISVWGGSDTIISGNTCYKNNGTGIRILINSHRSKILGNDCYDNKGSGISISNNCLNTTVQGNNLFYNEDGISLNMADLITIEGNNCSFNTEIGISLTGSDNITIKNNFVNNNLYYGIYLGDYHETFSIYSHNNKLSGNDCNYNNIGIFSLGGGNHNITGNNCDKNRGFGILLQSNSLDNKILGNNCSFNSINGINALDNSYRTTIIGNNCSYNEEHGMNVEDSNDYTIIDNIMSHNGESIPSFCGLYIENSNNTNIMGNTLNNNNYAGVWIKGDGYNLTGNTCNYNEYEGIILQGNNNNASLNTCRGNTEVGIYIFSGTGNEVAWNALIGNLECIVDLGTGTVIHDNICGNRPSSFLLESNPISPINDGNFMLFWNATGAVNYTVYIHSSFITEINASLGAPLASNMTLLSLSLTGYSDGTYYFIVVAHNAYGDTLSDCIEVVVLISEGSGPEIPGYPLFLLLTFFTLITTILIAKKRGKLVKF